MKPSFASIARGAFAVGSILWALVAFAAQDAHEHEEASGNPLQVNADQQAALGIKIETVSARALSEEIRAPGEVRANDYATVLIGARMSATIVKRHVKLGDIVKPAQALVTISSVELAQTQGELLNADREWRRVRALGADAVSGRRFSEAQVLRDQARAKARAYGLSEAQIATLLRQGSTRANGEIDLLAPQAGRVTRDDFIVGERVEPGRVLITLVDESSVWIDAKLSAELAARVAAGASARVRVEGREVIGHVVQRAHLTEESTRTRGLRVEMPNQQDALHPGEFVDVFIATAQSSRELAVPTRAIVQIQGENIVFRLHEAGEFEIAPVEVGAARGDWTVIRGGLSADERIAVDGAYALKARLLKSRMGEGHAH